MMLRNRLTAALLLTAPLPICGFSQGGVATPTVVESASKTVVLFRGTTDSGTIVGSGFLVSADGKIVTNLHVVREMRSGGVQLASGEVYDKLTILAFDDRKDLAIVKIPGFDLPAIELGNSNDVKPGEPVLAIGNPQGLQGTITAGVVSAVRDDPFSGGYKVIQTDAASNPGNSGGPLINSKGQVIGVVTSKLRASEGLNFAIPVNYVRGLMSTNGKPMTLAELRLTLSTASVDAFQVAPPFPTRWKSMTSGNEFQLRKESDVVYVEQARSDASKRVGNFVGSELHKGKNGYSGTERMVMACSYLDRWKNTEVTSHCSFEYPIEIPILSVSRIEGRILIAPRDSKFDCKKCTFNKRAAWQSFVWIPE